MAEAFQKGPITVSAKVTRKDRSLPLFQVPVLRFQDRLAFSFSGEAFDPRVTQADWSLIIVFLPRTIAPTAKGVVSLELARTPAGMIAPAITVPYDAIPMIFLVPDSGGRKKILADLNAHLADFRKICLKLSDLSEQRAQADQFLKSLEAIKQDQSAPSYDSALFNVVKAYGGQLSQDLQIFISRNTGSNLEKFQFLVSEFKRTNLAVPASSDASTGVSIEGSALNGRIHPASLYVSIAFDLIQVFQNLWPGHKFQYVPALGRDFSGFQAQLYYNDWIQTTGDVRGALVFSPCRWQDADNPTFQFEVAPSDSILHPYTRLSIHPDPRSNPPLALFGHDWHLALKGPDGESLDSLPLVPNQAQQAFIIEPSDALLKLQQKGVRQVQARIEGAWGFQPVTSKERPLIAGLDPAWKPSQTERDRFMLGQSSTFVLPSPWGSAVTKAWFRPAATANAAIPAVLHNAPDGSCTLSFPNLQGEPGPGFLEASLDEKLPAALSVPLVLQFPLPVVDDIRAHQGENAVLLMGRNLQNARTLLFGGQAFTRTRETPEGTLFSAIKGVIEGEPGAVMEGTLKLSDDRILPVKATMLLPPRPVLQEVEVIPMAALQGLPMTSEMVPLATTASVMVSAISGHKGRYPLGRSPKLLIRNTDDPGTPAPLPAKAIKLTGRGQRLLASFTPSELLGTHAAGHLEIQVQDAAVGTSAWTPLPALFLELPTILNLHQEGTAWRAEGTALDTIERSASSTAGPWVPATIGFQGGKEFTSLAAPDGNGVVYLKLYGWPDLLIRLQGPAQKPTRAAKEPTPGDKCGTPSKASNDKPAEKPRPVAVDGLT